MSWRVEIANLWDVLGPFPIHAREQHFLSPAFPLNISEPIDYTKSWPSAYADDGCVKWDTSISDDQGNINISFPQIRWTDLRATEGWAALQHHAILRTTLTLFPQVDTNSQMTQSPRLLVELKQGSYFTLRPRTQSFSSFVPEWYAGNIYDMERAQSRVVLLPETPSLLEPTSYDVFVSGDYEIRLFGDPVARKSEIPVQTLNFHVQVQSDDVFFAYHPSQTVVCDFIDGFAFGEAIGIGIQSIVSWWTVTDVVLQNDSKGISLRLRDRFTIAPSQTRVIPIVIEQTAPFKDDSIQLHLSLTSGQISQKLSVIIPVVHKNWGSSERQALKGTFFFLTSNPSAFIALPPMLEPPRQQSPILALHGAGVDIFGQDFWVKSLPKAEFSWVVVPTGRTSWGLDWHGPSAKDVWSTLEALVSILHRNSWRLSSSWLISANSSVVLVGHSNGGQGTWYLASHYPDRVVAAVPAAAYIKSQSYVPLTLARSGHFIDPILRGILESSFTPDDNDLHISNLVDTPILAIHGGEDENVPVWNSRELIGILRAWNPVANTRMREDPGKGHWYSSILNNPEVESFINEMAIPGDRRVQSDAFTLTVTIPAESGPLHGWNIQQLKIPGRFGRLHICVISDARIRVETCNVQSFQLAVLVLKNPCDSYEFHVDDSVLIMPQVDDVAVFYTTEPGKWQLTTDYLTITHPPSRIQTILTSAAPITLLAANKMIAENLSVALRIAHDLHLYHKLDTEIITESVALHRSQSGTWPAGNVVFIGTASSQFAKLVLQEGKTSFQIVGSDIDFNHRRLNKPREAVLFTHPHPAGGQGSMLFIMYNDKDGLERASRLFPIRTGVAVPDWMIVGNKMDNFGAGGIKGAGVWGSNWKLNASMSWQDW
ncbi:hypothetical protein BYT27DRAFT_7109472 [Phlegmacium glaucopus]|nr:hypothetical protein BYT27DRAFT_7109472 [Phlegmacium glaucopus]